MRLEIFNDQKEEDKVVRLKMEQHEDEVLVFACDSKGQKFSQGNLVCFYPDGVMRRIGGINQSIGFDLNPDGQIKERE